MSVLSDYPHAQWFEAPPPCRVCGKPAGVLRSFYGNNALAYMCKAHAEKEIKAAHRKGDFFPDEVLAQRAASSTPAADDAPYQLLALADDGRSEVEVSPLLQAAE